MATRDLVLAPLLPSSKKKRSRARKRHLRNAAVQPDGAAFSELEQAFFADAPPDEPADPVEPERFEDDLCPPPRAHEAWFESLRWAAATTGAALRRLVTLVRRQLRARR